MYNHGRSGPVEIVPDPLSNGVFDSLNPVPPHVTSAPIAFPANSATSSAERCDANAMADSFLNFDHTLVNSLTHFPVPSLPEEDLSGDGVPSLNASSSSLCFFLWAIQLLPRLWM